ncbi:MAG: hypothetical protein ACI94Y_000054 [Maribacter sp.]
MICLIVFCDSVINEGSRQLIKYAKWRAYYFDVKAKNISIAAAMLMFFKKRNQNLLGVHVLLLNYLILIGFLRDDNKLPSRQSILNVDLVLSILHQLILRYYLHL